VLQAATFDVSVSVHLSADDIAIRAVLGLGRCLLYQQCTF